ncbi:hypothetical protein CBR_g23808 [Chara braunii]|uniref:Reverse transcriptase domain-containing protein n=1 Tax=Chara braunii TaxID=69332 RepID=A0A388JVQ0_CHABU|nr:hypothetical protein CBR_g23808 [Chara braunii]|eukprot:GBG61855.1 hypothetical protein CBR_g23808 [Chara braunii]
MAEAGDEAGKGGGRSPPPPNFWVMEDRVRYSIGQCYDEGVLPIEPNMGEVVEDERGRRFKVNESLDAIKEKWLKERTVIFIFQDEVRNLARGVKEDLICALEDGWLARRLFSADVRRGRIKFEGPNVVSCVARASEVGTWLMQFVKTELGRVPLEAMYYLPSAVEGLIGGLKQMHAPEADRSRPKLMNVKNDMDPQARFKVEDTLIIESPKGEWWKVEVATPYSDWCSKRCWYFHTEENCPRQGYDRGPRGQGNPNLAQHRAPSLSDPGRAAHSADGAGRPDAAPQASQASHARGAIGTRDAVRPSQGFATSAQPDRRRTNTAQARDQSVLAQYPHVIANPTLSPAPHNQSYSLQAAQPPPPPPPDRALMPEWTIPGEWPASVYAAPHPGQWQAAPNLAQGHQEVNYRFHPTHHSNPDPFHPDPRFLYAPPPRYDLPSLPPYQSQGYEYGAPQFNAEGGGALRPPPSATPRGEPSSHTQGYSRLRLDQRQDFSQGAVRDRDGYFNAQSHYDDGLLTTRDRFPQEDRPPTATPASSESKVQMGSDLMGDELPVGRGGDLQAEGSESSTGSSSGARGGRNASSCRQSRGTNLTEWVLMTVYAPADPSSRAAFFQTLLSVIPQSEHLIMVVDWNVSLDEALTDGTRTTGRRDAVALMDLIQELELSDPFRSLSLFTSGYTWFSKISQERGDVTHRRLDYFMVTGGLAQGVTADGPDLHPMSDHRPVLAEMVLTPSVARGRGYFKLNSLNLKDPGIKGWVEEQMGSWDTARQFFPSTAKWLDGGLTIISGMMSVCSRILAKGRNVEEERCRKGVEEAERRMEAHPISKRVWAAKRERRLAEWEGLQATKQAEWEELLSIKVLLTNGERLALDRPITEEELQHTLKVMASGKCPGVDGLTVEFYRTCWGALGPPPVEVFNEVLSGGRLGELMTHGVISLMFKKGDKANVRNYKPISVLNVDYKILAKTLAIRLGKILPRLVECDQGAFVQGRSIFYNILTAIEALEVVNAENNNVAILLLDLEKAYDRVGWPFVLTMLKKIDFGQGSCRWIIAMYTLATSSVIVNGHLSRPFNLTRSLRQGCPLAPLLFVLQLEIPLNRIRKHPDIRGISLAENCECIVKALADDLFIASVNTESSLNALKETLAEYSFLSEALVNWSKSAYTLPEEFSLQVEWGMKRVDSSSGERFLGVMISLQVMGSVQGLILQQRVAARLQVWGPASHLSLFGRALVVNVALWALLWFVGAVREISAAVLTAIRRLVARFLWKPRAGIDGGFMVKVAWDLITYDRDEGGLGLIDPHRKNLAQLRKWISRIAMADVREDWILLAERILTSEWRLSRPADVWVCFFMHSFMNRRLKSEFWEAVRKAWKDHPPEARKKPQTKEEVLLQPLFENPFIVDSQGKPFSAATGPAAFGLAWIRRGISRIQGLWSVILGSWRPFAEVRAQLQNLWRVEQNWRSLLAAIPLHWRQLLGPEGIDPLGAWYLQPTYTPTHMPSVTVWRVQDITQRGFRKVQVWEAEEHPSSELRLVGEEVVESWANPPQIRVVESLDANGEHSHFRWVGKVPLRALMIDPTAWQWKGGNLDSMDLTSYAVEFLWT